MAEMQHYFVEQTRVVDVVANNAADAGRIAAAAFAKGQQSNGRLRPADRPECWGDTESHIRETGLLTTRKRR